MDNMQNGGGKNVCKCHHHKMMPIMLILIGVTFLLGALNILTSFAVSVIWPTLLIILGVKKMVVSMCKCC